LIRFILQGVTVMLKIWLGMGVVLSALAGSAMAGDGAYQALFNGKNLEGWHNPYDWGQAKVVDGEIHLQAPKGKKFFLVTDATFGDFEFQAEVKLPEGKANSGFMFRCHAKPNKVMGYQAEVDPSDRAWAGGLYDEGRRGWLNPLKDQPRKQNAWRHGEWNHYRIKCVGDRLRIWVNGIKTTDYRDPVDLQGHLALQHHGEKGKTYRFRHIQVKRLGRHAWQPIFNGKNLDGWHARGEGDWRVESGHIVGTLPSEDADYGMLISDESYDDFTARVKFRIQGGNSGFYFRAKPVEKHVILHGIQCEIATNYNTAGFYETGGVGWLAQPGEKRLGDLYTPGQWATMTLSAHGQKVVSHLGSKKAAEIETTKWTEGPFGLQLHGGMKTRLDVASVELLKPVEE
jgi:hypothetical protein